LRCGSSRNVEREIEMITAPVPRVKRWGTRYFGMKLNNSVAALSCYGPTFRASAVAALFSYGPTFRALAVAALLLAPIFGRQLWQLSLLLAPLFGRQLSPLSLLISSAAAPMYVVCGYGLL
jgi:hypothetical protein